MFVFKLNFISLRYRSAMEAVQSDYVQVRARPGSLDDPAAPLNHCSSLIAYRPKRLGWLTAALGHPKIKPTCHSEPPVQLSAVLHNRLYSALLAPTSVRGPAP